MERKVDAIDRAGRELAHLEAETIRKMHAQERLRLLQDRIVKYAHELLHFDHFAIRMVNPKTNALDLVMASGIPDKAKEIRLFAQESGNGTSGRVAATGISYVCNDTSKDDLYVYGLDEPGSSLTVALRVYDRVVGIFNVESTERHAFSDNDRQFAEIFASYIASALHTLNLLVVERYTTSEAATGTVHGEISGPLNDLVAEVELLRRGAGDDNELTPHLDRILRDVSSIRRRMKNVARGPQSLLGVDEILEAGRIIPELENRRILVADNEEGILATIRDVLVAVGCQVVTCDDGTSAIRLLETWQHTFDADEGFDLVLSDINLGDKTGYDVFGAAKRARATLPVILITGFGYDPHHSIVRATQEGLQSVLFKPFQAEKLIDEVRKAVGPPSSKGPTPAGD
jgi:CheY-like chemotaxis protein